MPRLAKGKIMTRTASLMIVLLLVFGTAAYCNEGADDSDQLGDLLTEAAEGNVGSQYLLGFMYAEGLGIDPDPVKARHWYLKAAEQGHTDAQMMLAMMAADGTGGAADQAESIKWYTAAAKQGNPDAQAMLSMIYTEGKGVTVDYVEAYKWSLMAEANGRDRATSKDWLIGRMMPAEIEEAKQRVKVFVANHPTAVKQLELAAETTDDDDMVLEKGQFTVRFPNRPKRTVMKDNDQLRAVHYQSLNAGGKVQYNASFQYFKQNKLIDDQVQFEFLYDYLVGRTIYAYKHKLQKKHARFRNYNAAMFKHMSHVDGVEKIHEGIIFIAEGDFVSLTCVYPSDVTPSPSFGSFINSFEFTQSESELID